MSKSRLVAAVDVGSDKITTLIAQVNEDEMTQDRSVNIIGVSSVESKGVKKGQIVDIEQAVESIISSVEPAERMAGYNLDRAFISVGGSHISSQNSKGVVAVSNASGEVTDEDINRVIEAARAISHPASREIIHVLPREFIVDGESGVRDPVGMAGVRLEVETHIVTASAAALRNLTKSVNEVGIDVQDTVFTGLASSFSTLTQTEKELGCVLIDIGSGTTSICAFVDGALAYSGSIPIGARNVTNDLAIGLRVSLESAEKIKLNLNQKSSSTDKHGKELIEVSETGNKNVKKVTKRTVTEGIVKPRLNEIFTMVKSELDKHNLTNRIPSGSVITGGGALTVGVDEVAKKILGIPTRTAKPTGVKGLVDDIIDPRFSAAVGLILYASQSEQFSAGGQGQGAGGIKMPDSAIFGKVLDSIKKLLP